MLCRKCEKGLQAAAKGLELLDRLKRMRVDICVKPLHYSLRNFYKSILAGCFICRWAWATLIQGPGLPDSQPHRGPTFLEDPKQLIPSSIGEFRDKISQLADVYTDGLGASSPYPSVESSIIPKTGSLPAIRFIRHLLRHLLFPVLRYKKDSFLYNKVIKQDWDEKIAERSRMRIGLQDADNLGDECYYVPVCFENTLLGQLELRPVAPDTPRSINALQTELNFPTASTADAGNLWRYWFSTCSENHADCQVAKQQMQSFRPTRLVQLLQDDQGVISTWRLDCKSSANNANTVPYLTLSHCWGSSQPVRLTKGNLPQFQVPSPTAELPKTYQHALATTQSLGFSHIWIDSLCIIQDDDDDWRAESALMGTIYSHATCNIGACWATDDSQGYFSTIDPVAKTATFISLERPVQDSPVQHHIGQVSAYYDEIKRSPLNQRGWVVQERYLARRQLSFAKRQTYWECRQLVASEEFPLGLPESLEVSKPHLEFEKGTDTRGTWAELVEFYSTCDLSYKRDKLVALSGLINRLENITNDECFFGLWKKNLHMQLCWTLHHSLYRRAAKPKMPCHIAPTWSWANIDGPVAYDPTYHHNELTTVLPWIRVVEFSAEKLILQGVALWGLADPRRFDRYIEKVQFYLPGRTGPSMPLSIYIFRDEHLPTVETPRNSNLLFLVVRCDEFYGADKKYVGLMLRKQCCSTTGGEKYVRVGQWNTFHSDVKPLHEELAVRLGISAEDSFKTEYLDDPRMADMVHTVTIV